MQNVTHRRTDGVLFVASVLLPLLGCLFLACDLVVLGGLSLPRRRRRTWGRRGLLMG
ncbi:hypothetical protein ckrop_2017 [Corynebacterium kroppenstedtii DSM 44385]|uniref:Uncharacterized protein n=1 Tax=Corynebacterium kroppenstedtii (strain DSM 44385 / JCM 11950 / CIP 105744 / CCUG 35717) TaxID=645127 RepID=C4LLL7_CORK4|nr:hypothetical protein ckrop_2017 [Corynebacterium kroppenstedtii DSM 44385]